MENKNNNEQKVIEVIAKFEIENYDGELVILEQKFAGQPLIDGTKSNPAEDYKFWRKQILKSADAIDKPFKFIQVQFKWGDAE